MTNRVDSDQLASEEANLSGSTLLARAGHILVQQDNGLGCLVLIVLRQYFRCNSSWFRPFIIDVVLLSA